jgi:formate/nitrite transporter FocA (FNT family)
MSQSESELESVSRDLSSPKSKSTILDEQIDSALTEMRRPDPGTFLSGLAAGLDIAFGPLLMIGLLALIDGTWNGALTELALASAYAFGFVLVVLGRTELFTEHTTLAVLPVLDNQASLGSLARFWGLIYVENIVGESLFTAGMVWVAPRYGIASLETIGELATPFAGIGLLPLFFGAVLARWLMGLMSFLVTAAKETTSRLIFVALIAGVIGLLKLPHSIAGNVEVLSGALVGAVPPSFYVIFLALATVGNIIGGSVFVALLRYTKIRTY